MSLDVYLKAEDKDGNEICVYSAKITHNLGLMADKAGIYFALWRPEEKDWKFAKDIIPILKNGIKELENDPEYFKQFDDPNRWGIYDHFLPFVKEYLEACRKYPSSRIVVWR